MIKKHYIQTDKDGICSELCMNVSHIPEGVKIGSWFCSACSFRLSLGTDKTGNWIKCEKLK